MSFILETGVIGGRKAFDFLFCKLIENAKHVLFCLATKASQARTP